MRNKERPGKPGKNMKYSSFYYIKQNTEEIQIEDIGNLRNGTFFHFFKFF